jgi:hypothetical protein
MLPKENPGHMTGVFAFLGISLKPDAQAKNHVDSFAGASGFVAVFKQQTVR